MSDYEWQVQLAAKGLHERDNHPMPKSVTTRDAFYEVMAGAALDAIDLRALLERVARAERELETIRETSRQADIQVENAQHVLRPERPRQFEQDLSSGPRPRHDS